jgi:ABC-type transport system involved in multi-copper enzyme maturation permease subunit
MMKKTWADVAACALFLGVIVSVMFVMYVLVQAVSGIISPYETVTFHPPGSWIALALLYNIALLTVAFVMATIGGIAVRDLYISAKTGQLPGSTETGPTE